MSTYFSPQRAVYGTGRDVPTDPADVIAALPVPVVDPNDPGAAVLATTSGTPHRSARTRAAPGPRRCEPRATVPSLEVPLRLVRASLEIGAPEDARKRLAELRFGDVRRLATALVQRTMRAARGRIRQGCSRFRRGAGHVARRARPQTGDRGHRRIARRARRRCPLLRDGVANRPQLRQRRIRAGEAACASG